MPDYGRRARRQIRRLKKRTPVRIAISASFAATHVAIAAEAQSPQEVVPK